jgi:hypothetical protein
MELVLNDGPSLWLSDHRFQGGAKRRRARAQGRVYEPPPTINPEYIRTKQLLMPLPQRTATDPKVSELQTFKGRAYSGIRVGMSGLRLRQTRNDANWLLPILLQMP